jgi:hypothetical protein
MRKLIIDAMEEEIPPAPAPIYSIGEEQGPGYGKVIAWSPLGLSRYRRSLLAVVSTNYKIYIFEPVGRMSDDMRVVHDLSPMLADYDGLPKGDEEIMEKAWRKRLRARCMGMAWSQACVTEGNRWGESLVALANDYLEIVLFRFLFLSTAFCDVDMLIGFRWKGFRTIERRLLVTSFRSRKRMWRNIWGRD